MTDLPDDAHVDEPAVEAGTKAPSSTPSPRPRSATSRARRIGGAAAAPRSDADTARLDDAAANAAAAKAASSVPDKADSSARPGKPDKSSRPSKGAKATDTAKAASAATTAKPARRATAVRTESKDPDAKRTPRQVTVSVPNWVRWAPGFAFSAVAVVFLTLFAIAQLGGDDQPASTSSTVRDEVLAAAKTCLATLNTYRYDQLDRAETAGTACTTGKLTSDFKKTVSTVIRKNAPPLKAVQIAKINTAGIEAVTGNGKQWTVLAYGQLNITTANTGKQGQIDPFAVVARLQQANGKWVLSKIDTVSSYAS